MHGIALCKARIVMGRKTVMRDIVSSRTNKCVAHILHIAEYNCKTGYLIYICLCRLHSLICMCVKIVLFLYVCRISIMYSCIGTVHAPIVAAFLGI